MTEKNASISKCEQNKKKEEKKRMKISDLRACCFISHGERKFIFHYLFFVILFLKL